MKTRTIITELNHDDLVDLFSTALYGSSLFSAYYDKKDYKKCNPSENDCFEDKLAKILLNGYSVIVCDHYADEDEFYGDLPHDWDEADRCVEYTVTLEDIKNGIGKALDQGGWTSKCAMDFINHEEGDLDLPEAEELVQWILFGETIYG
jgi:hypothetical protein